MTAGRPRHKREETRMSEANKMPDFKATRKAWMARFGKSQSYPRMCAFRMGLEAFLETPVDAVEIRRVSGVMLLVPGGPAGPLQARAAVVMDLDTDDKGEDFSATLTRKQA